MVRHNLSLLERRNRHFDALVSRPGLMWLGQNTNHLAPHPAVRSAMIECIDSGECHTYAPPLGLEELRQAILEDLGLDSEFSVIATDGAIEGLYHACHTLLGPDDELIVTDPGWIWPRRFAASIDSGECHTYAPPLGLEELRQAILEDLGLDSEFSVIATDGAIEGLYHACHTLLGPETNSS